MLLWTIIIFSLVAVEAKAADFDEGACRSCVAKGCTYCLFSISDNSTCITDSLDPTTGRCSDHTDCSLREWGAESLNSNVDCFFGTRFFETVHAEAVRAVVILVLFLILCCCSCFLGCSIWYIRFGRVRVQQQPPTISMDDSDSDTIRSNSSHAPTTTSTAIPYSTSAGVMEPPILEMAAPQPPSTNPNYVPECEGADAVPKSSV